ncbi:sperm microtubule associated protein 2-like [Pangshura tecta]
MSRRPACGGAALPRPLGSEPGRGALPARWQQQQGALRRAAAGVALPSRHPPAAARAPAVALATGEAAAAGGERPGARHGGPAAGCGRMSEIWQRPPLMDLALPSPRILKLAEPKKYQTAYLKQRPRSSPEWPVPTAALTCEASQRVLELARPKSVHPGFLLDRKVETQITDAAKTTLTPPRTQRLAQPKIQKNTLCYDRGSPESMICPVSRSAQQAVASVRTLDLAKAKLVSPEYLPARDTEWPVTKAAKHAVTTPRIEELSQPCKRLTVNLAQFDPDAFLVKESAKKAVCSSRLQKLARPIER